MDILHDDLEQHCHLEPGGSRGKSVRCFLVTFADVAVSLICVH
jgi:hypothetical protein